MRSENNKNIVKKLLTIIIGIFLFGCDNESHYPILDHNKLASEYYQEDAQWYLDNIPFFECSDKQIRTGILLPVETLQSAYPPCR